MTIKDKATIYDVAEEANVSPATVSRYLNRTSAIAKEKVTAIERAIYDLGFRPKPRGNKANRTMRIGVVAPSYETSYVTHLLDGMDMGMYHLAYEIIIETTQWKVEREKRELENLVRSGVDGLVIMGGLLEESIIKEIVGDLPTLTICRSPQGIFPDFNVDSELGGYMATNHLIQLGHTKIAHIHGPMQSQDARDRLAGYKRALNSAGMEINDKLIVDGEYSEDGGFRAIEKLLKRGVPFTGIFVSNDVCSYGAIQALYQHNISVPNDISIVGFDDLPLSKYFIPRLTTIRQPFKELGSIAIRYLIDLINGYKPKYDAPNVNLIARESCKRL
ncbi:LacI family DNA-binding transcriptional regulator [Vibrio maerlii]|uniref:LacI family DNA-binding transcriptional regulator n=1 Tax=Vibrio maerlii TaxID=2231648 RepID=UPI001F145CB6|nr:substrate-binding domain-containing protein [Vibrio maerlii]